LDYVDLGVDIISMRGYDLLADAVDVGRHVIPVVREEVAKRDLAAATVLPGQVRSGRLQHGAAGRDSDGVVLPGCARGRRAHPGSGGGHADREPAVATADRFSTASSSGLSGEASSGDPGVRWSRPSMTS
jgi:hypothetical protein